MVCGNDQISGHRDLESATDGHAVDCSDHRRRTVGQLGEPTEPTHAVVAVERFVGGEIPPGREELRPGAGDDDRPHVLITVERGEHVTQCFARGRVDRVGLRSIDGDDSRGAIQFDMESGHVISSNGVASNQSASTATAPVLPTSTGLSSTSTALRADHRFGQGHDEGDQGVDIGRRLATEAAEQWVAPQLRERQAHVGRGHRGEQVCHITPHLGRHATESEGDQPADRRITAHGDEHLRDHVGHRGFDEVAVRRTASMPTLRPLPRRCAAQP